jgi:tRNA dimethylallyltransferase
VSSISNHYLVLAGPTGSGKSALALALAPRLDAEIISCDSVQVYRGFDIGSAKPTAAEQAAVPHHLLDVVDATGSFDAALFAKAAGEAITEIHGRGRLPLVAGGTGLYLRALLGQGWHADLPSDPALREQLAAEATATLYARLRSLDPERAAVLHPNDRVRIVRAIELVTLLGSTLRDAGLTLSGPLGARDPRAVIVVLEPPRVELHARIAARTEAMLAGGLPAEVQALLASGVPSGCKPMQSIGYLQAAQHLQGILSATDLPGAIIAATRQYAKRQGTWFRKVDADLRLTAWDDVDEVLRLCQERLAVRREER